MIKTHISMIYICSFNIIVITFLSIAYASKNCLKIPAPAVRRQRWNLPAKNVSVPDMELVACFPHTHAHTRRGATESQIICKARQFCRNRCTVMRRLQIKAQWGRTEVSEPSVKDLANTV